MELSGRTNIQPLRTFALLIAALIIAPLVFRSPAMMTALFTALVYGAAAIGLDYYSGLSGQLAFGNFGFVAIGAYTVPVFVTHTGMPAWAAVPLAPLICAVVAAVVGLPMSRLSGFGSVFITFFFGFLIQALLNGQSLMKFTGGSNGVTVPPLSLGSLNLETSLRAEYYTALVIVAVVGLSATLLARRRPGQELRLVKRNPTAAAITGVRVTRARILAFAFAAAAAGLAGVIYSQALVSVTPESFSAMESITLFAMVAVGGRGTLIGGLLGAVFYEVLTADSSSGGQETQIVFCVVVLMALVAMPRGIVGAFSAAYNCPPVRWVREGASGRWIALAGSPAGRRLRRTLGAAGQEPRAVLSQVGVAAAAREVKGAALTVQNLSVSYSGVMALENVSLKIPASSTFAIIGPNGAGKTTLLNCISRIQPATHGAILLDGRQLGRVRPQDLAALGIARTFQHPTVALDLSALENVELGVRRRDISDGVTRREMAHEALLQTGLPTRREGLPAGDLSLGEQKLIDIARAIAGSSRLILMDEPTAGLEEHEIDAVAAAIMGLRKRTETTIVVVAHHIGFVRKVAQHALLLNLGRVFAEGDPEELVHQPEVTELFLGAPVD